MKVNIETDWGYRAEAELDGTTFVMDAKPEQLFASLNEVRVWGEGYRKYFFNPTVMEMPSTDDKFRFKLVNPTPTIERLKNIEDALVELYELLEV